MPGRTVFGDVVEVIPTDNDCPRHLRGDDLAGQDSPTD